MWQWIKKYPVLTIIGVIFLLCVIGFIILAIVAPFLPRFFHQQSFLFLPQI
jgi:hypothetical protein